MKDKFLLGVKALILKDNQILLVKRGPKAPTFPLHWDFPGGMVGNDELPDDAVLREVEEETGLSVGNSALISNTKFMKNGEPTIVLIYLMDYGAGEVKLSFEHDEYKWVEISKVVDEKLQPWLLDHLRIVLEKFGQPQ